MNKIDKDVDLMVNVVLREWKLSDVDSVFKYANNKNVARNLRNTFPYPYVREDAENFITACINADKTKKIYCAIDINGEAVGSIGVFLKDDVYCKDAEIGYWLAQEFWGQGIMTEAVRQMVEIAFDKLDIVRISAGIFEYNMGSRRALEKNGFVLEGVLKKSIYKNGEIYDSCMYALTK